jgi:hypothetical protein
VTSGKKKVMEPRKKIGRPLQLVGAYPTKLVIQ